MSGELSKLLLPQTLGLNAFLAAAFIVAATDLHVSWVTVVLILLAFIGARNAGHAFNQIVDMQYDTLNPRTQGRPLVTGKMSVRTAALVVGVNVALLLVSAWLLNLLVLLLVPIALLLVMGYSYTKRFTAWTTVMLGMVQSMVPAGIYLATRESLPPVALAGAAAVLLFGTAFETVHSLGDIESDRRFHLKSIPVALGEHHSVTLAGGLFASSMVLFGVFGYLAGFGYLFYAALAGMSIFSALEVRFVQTEHTSMAQRVRQSLEGGSPLVANLAIGALFFLGVVLGAYPPTLP